MSGFQYLFSKWPAPMQVDFPAFSLVLEGLLQRMGPAAKLRQSRIFVARCSSEVAVGSQERNPKKADEHPDKDD